MHVRRFERSHELSTDFALVCDEESEIVLKCMGTAQTTCCRDHTNMAHISPGTAFCMLTGTFCSIQWVLCTLL
jgi:hypothetical protein